MPGGKASLCVLTDGDPEGCHENNPNFGVVRRERKRRKGISHTPPPPSLGAGNTKLFFAEFPVKLREKESCDFMSWRVE